MINFIRHGQKCSFTLTKDLFEFLRTEKNIHFGAGNRVGTQFQFFEPAAVSSFSSLFVGNTVSELGGFSYTRSPLVHGMRIGNYCSIANGVQQMGVNHPYTRFSSSSFTYDRQYQIFAACKPDLKNRFEPKKNKLIGTPPAQIHHDVWIGGSVILANGISIGTGAIIGAGALVTKDVAPYEIVGGNPAKLIRKRFPDEVCARLLEMEWYLYQFPHFSNVDVEQDIDIQLDQLERIIAAGDAPKIPKAEPFLKHLEEFSGKPLG